MEETNGPWYFKENEDGVFVKLNEERVKNRKGNLMEQVLEVKESPTKGRDNNHVVITFKDMISPNGKFDMKFALVNFLFDKNDFTKNFLEHQSSAREFEKKYRQIIRSAGSSTPSTSGATNQAAVTIDEAGDTALTDPTLHKTPVKKGKRSNKRKSTTPAPEGVELLSPKKLYKPNTLDEDIEAHYLGLFCLKVSSLKDCPPKWLDRRIDQARVDEIAKGIESCPASMHNAQPWLAVAGISKADVQGDKNLIKGAKIEVIGGLHRRAAYKKLLMANEKLQTSLGKVWVSVYDSSLSDEQVCRLAAKHNLDNTGSQQTVWMERVAKCRQWLYKMVKADVDEDDTPAPTTAWKKTCQNMYMATGKDVNSLEPTLQAAILPKSTYDLLLEVSREFHKGNLKDMKKEKPSRRKSVPQLTQNQVGMPLQGLEKATKEDLLTKVLRKQLSLKELREAADNIKKKKNVVKAFMKFTGEDSWQSLQRRFPHHATEEKLAQFKDVPMKRHQTSPMLESFFRRALAWEKEEMVKGVDVTQEKSGIFLFHSRKEATTEVGILIAGEQARLPFEQIKEISPTFKGFDLVILNLEKDADEKEIKKFLLSLHAGNVDSKQRYNVAIVVPDADTCANIKCLDDINNKFVCVQRAFWYDTRTKKPQGHLLQNSLMPMLICHWAANDIACNLKDDASNVFACQSYESNPCSLPTELVSLVMDKFSFEGQWVLDLTKSKGAGIVAGLACKRNVVCLQAQEELRLTASEINKACVALSTAELEREENEDNEDSQSTCSA